MTDTKAARWTSGRVETGPGARYVHLVFRLRNADRWETACPADVEQLGGAAASRQVRLVLELIDCPRCRERGRWELVVAVNQDIAAQRASEDGVRAVLARFLDWAAAEYPDGGAVLAAYDGGTRLHPMRLDERARAVDLFLAAERRDLDGA